MCLTRAAPCNQGFFGQALRSCAGTTAPMPKAAVFSMVDPEKFGLE
jgi:hypothetical protein